ncbi:MAG TPA: LysR family transcriptional regulator substrate-binding protein [Pyrinomonadaceae bacterium]|nr:LysR family transcriptional regulator substrate-binding protein [Pyrinomonadaceae bacterium]
MVSTDPLPQILKELRERHPRAEVTIASGTSQTLVRQILAGDLDMAFVSLPVEARGIQTEVLSRDELVAIASPRHKLAKQRVVSVFTLAGEKLILGERGGNTRRLIDGLFEETGVQPVVAMELSRLAAIKRMVEADMGVGIIPQHSTREEVEQGRLVAWWIEGAKINWELGLAKLAGDYESPICQTFTRLCRKHFNTQAQATASSRKRSKPSKSRQKPRAQAG